MLTFPNIDPILLHIGSFGIRWYSLAYIVGLLGGWLYVRWLDEKLMRGIGKQKIEDLMFWIIIGVIAGGRFGYVLFYKPEYYLQQPLEIFMLWNGGMSFHGGLIGVITAAYLFCRKQNFSFLSVIDLIASAAPIGLFLGRLANFINAELFGRVTEVPWGMVFPGGGALPRHPSQLYESLTEGLLLFIVLFIAVRFTKLPEKHGRLAGLFMAGYWLARTFCEQFREPDAFLGYFFGQVTMGQILSLPMLLIGLYLLFRKQLEHNR